MTRTATAADVMTAKDAWDVAVVRQRFAEAAMDADMTEATVRAVVAARKAQVAAWKKWDRAETMAA